MQLSNPLAVLPLADAAQDLRVKLASATSARQFTVKVTVRSNAKSATSMDMSPMTVHKI
jgi:hypothetical protein